MWEKIKAAFGRSTTIVVARATALWGMLTTAVPQVATQITDPTMMDKIKSVLPNPDVGKWLIFVGILVEICRWRTVKPKDQ